MSAYLGEKLADRDGGANVKERNHKRDPKLDEQQLIGERELCNGDRANDAPHLRTHTDDG